MDILLLGYSSAIPLSPHKPIGRKEKKKREKNILHRTTCQNNNNKTTVKEKDSHYFLTDPSHRNSDIKDQLQTL